MNKGLKSIFTKKDMELPFNKSRKRRFNDFIKIPLLIGMLGYTIMTSTNCAGKLEYRRNDIIEKKKVGYIKNNDFRMFFKNFLKLARKQHHAKKVWVLIQDKTDLNKLRTDLYYALKKENYKITDYDEIDGMSILNIKREGKEYSLKIIFGKSYKYIYYGSIGQGSIISQPIMGYKCAVIKAEINEK